MVTCYTLRDMARHPCTHFTIYHAMADNLAGSKAERARINQGNATRRLRR